MNKEQILGFVRHVLTFGGGYLVAKGVIPESLLGEAVGAIMTLVGVVWSAKAPEKKF